MQSPVPPSRGLAPERPESSGLAPPRPSRPGFPELSWSGAAPGGVSRGVRGWGLPQLPHHGGSGARLRGTARGPAGSAVPQTPIKIPLLPTAPPIPVPRSVSLAAPSLPALPSPLGPLAASRAPDSAPPCPRRARSPRAAPCPRPARCSVGMAVALGLAERGGQSRFNVRHVGRGVLSGTGAAEERSQRPAQPRQRAPPGPVSECAPPRRGSLGPSMRSLGGVRLSARSALAVAPPFPAGAAIAA